MDFNKFRIGIEDLDEFTARPKRRASSFGADIALCDEQEEAVQRILTGHEQVQILTGVAGSGKSTVLSHLMREHSHQVAVCATTGRAAVNNGCMITVDSMFGINRKDWKLNGRDRLRRVPRIVLIDEGSMVGSKMYELVRQAADNMGKRIVLVGDWTQAKPVMDEWITKNQWFQDDNPPMIRLVKNHRQGDGPFLDELNKIRVGKQDAVTDEIFRGRILRDPPAGDHVIRLYATNAEAARYNEIATRERATQINWPVMRLCSQFYDRRKTQAWEIRAQEKEDIIDSARLANQEPITYGSRVMITYNAPMDGDDREYVNGDLGVLEDIGFVEKTLLDGVLKDTQMLSAGMDYVDISDCLFKWLVADSFPGSPNHVMLKAKVRLDRTQELVTVNPVRVLRTSVFNGADHPLYEAVGVPLYSGYAITIHKSQGGTMDHVWLSMSSIRKMRKGTDGTGWHGLAYVGLSRARKIEGLYLDCWDPEVICFDEAVRSLL